MIVSALPVVFRRRVTVDDAATLLGTDPSQAIRLVATVTTNPPSLELNLRYSEGGPALPRQLLASFRFLRTLHRANRLGLWVGDPSVGEPLSARLRSCRPCPEPSSRCRRASTTRTCAR